MLRFLRMMVTMPSRLSSFLRQVRRRLAAGKFGTGTFPEPAVEEMETAGRPKFLGNPDVPAPCSSTPAGSTPPGHCGGSTRSPLRQRRGLPAKGNFGAQSHGFSTHCLRFARWVAPLDARLVSGCWPSSPRRDWLPVGFQRKVSECLLTLLSPFPSFLAQCPSPFLSHG
jgi:hypothetical protein